MFGSRRLTSDHPTNSKKVLEYGIDMCNSGNHIWEVLWEFYGLRIYVGYKWNLELLYLEIKLFKWPLTNITENISKSKS